jgi:hypothetical protein
MYVCGGDRSRRTSTCYPVGFYWKDLEKPYDTTESVVSNTF